MRGKTLGAASYDLKTGKILLLEDAPAAGLHLGLAQDCLDDQMKVDGGAEDDEVDSGHETGRKPGDLVQMLLEQIKPDTVLASSKCTERVLESLKAILTSTGGFNFQIRPAREYNFQAGKARLSTVTGAHLSGTQTDQLNKDRVLYTLSLVDLDRAPLSTSCAAALLYNISKMTSVTNDDKESINHESVQGLHGIKVSSLETLHLNECMTVNADSREALAIMFSGSENGWGKARQDPTLTLYAMLDHLRTPISHGLLRKWFLFPSMSLPTLSARHDAVDVFSSSGNVAVVDALVSHLKGIKNIPRLINTLQRGGTKLSMWKGLFGFCVKVLHIRTSLREMEAAQDVPIVSRILMAVDANRFQAIAESLDATIDWNQSAAEGRFVVKAQVDPQLDKWRELYAGLPSLLLNIANSLNASLDFEHSGQMNVAYFPQLGYLVALPFNAQVTTPEDMIVPEDWTFHFASEISTYWKNPQMYDLDHHVGDVHSFIADREVELIHDLSISIVEQGELLVHVAEICAELDVLLSFAQVANTYSWTRPMMTTSGTLDIRAGRHPLQELCIENFQPNDTLLFSGCGAGTRGCGEESDPKRSIEILTGANGCGKSIYLKQVSLIVFLAQIGSFVPAESATIGVVDQLLTRVQTQESASKAQSSFMSDLGQVSHALRNCTSRSLLILDEFGKGTLSHDGAALFAATIRYLLNRGKDCPRVLATTHFHDVFRPECLPPSLPYKASHMAIFLNESKQIDDDDEGTIPKQSKDMKDSITFLYRVSPGHVQQSHAAFCARACGIPKRVVDRAEYVTRLAEQHELDALHLESLLLDDKDDGENGGSGSQDENASKLVIDRSAGITVQRAKELSARMKRFIEWDIQAEIRRLEKWESGEEGGEEWRGSPLSGPMRPERTPRSS